MENEAIRPHVNGRFQDLLLAADSHPAMIAYLDNQYSVGPNSALAARIHRRGRQTKRKLDINENLAREILELHTLGVNGGYTQADVTAFAKVLTGWSIGGGRGLLAGGAPGAFYYRDNLHQPGKQTLLGTTYREAGMDQPRAVLADLARHPSTARHIATKLTRHFVADDPPVECVDKLSRAFLGSDGHLPKVYEALIGYSGAWRSEPAKFKTPADFVYSTYRGLDIIPFLDRTVLSGAKPGNDRLPLKNRVFVSPFELLGQRPYSPGSPAGWPDTSGDWDGADALMKRIEWTTALSDKIGDRAPPLRLADNSLGPLAGAHTLESVRRAATGSQGLALLLLSHEFQRR